MAACFGADVSTRHAVFFSAARGFGAETCAGLEIGCSPACTFLPAGASLAATEFREEAVFFLALAGLTLGVILLDVLDGFATGVLGAAFLAAGLRALGIACAALAVVGFCSAGDCSAADC